MAINSSVDTNTRDCIKLFMQIAYLSREICEVIYELLLHIYIHDSRFCYTRSVSRILIG